MLIYSITKFSDKLRPLIITLVPWIYEWVNIWMKRWVEFAYTLLGVTSALSPISTNPKQIKNDKNHLLICNYRSVLLHLCFWTQGAFGNFRGHFQLPQREGGCTGTRQVEATGANKPAPVHRTAVPPSPAHTQGINWCSVSTAPNLRNTVLYHVTVRTKSNYTE